MEPTEMEPTEQLEAKPTVNKKPVLLKILTVLFLIVAVTGFALFAMTQKQLSDSKKAQNATQEKLKTTEDSLTKANDKLKSAVFLPTQMSPQCFGTSNENAKLAPVNREPIDGFNVYILNCVDELAAGKNTSKVVAFKVTGTEMSFAFGAGSGEPFCISGKILPTSAAANISKQTGLPVCKTF